MAADTLDIVGIAGSLRRRSVNAGLLRAAAERAPTGARVEIASIREIPLYDGDLEAEQGVPAPVEALKDRIAAADALLIATPEYNGSLPGVLKNAIDWLSRPPKDIGRVFRDRPTALIGASPGRGGTAGSQDAWSPVLGRLGARAFTARRLAVARAGDHFDADGNLASEEVAAEVEAFMEAFYRFAAGA